MVIGEEVRKKERLDKIKFRQALKEAYDEGFSKGYNEGHKDGLEGHDHKELEDHLYDIRL